MTNCPVSVATVLRAFYQDKFRPMTSSDYSGFAGVEGKGFIYEPDVGDWFAICDHKPDGGSVMQVYYCGDENHDAQIWDLNGFGDLSWDRII